MTADEQSTFLTPTSAHEKGLDFAEPPVHTSVPAYTQAHLRVWPNPARDVVRVEGDGPLQFVTIYDLYGRVVMRVEGLADCSTEVNVSALPSGAYFIRTAAGISKFVKM